MTDDFTHSLLSEEWEEENEYRWCDNPDCIFHDPIHTPDECITAEQAEDYFKDQMKDTEEYQLALSDVNQIIDEMIEANQAKPRKLYRTGLLSGLDRLKNRINQELSYDPR